MTGIVILVVIGLFVAWGIATYNSLVGRRQLVAEGWAAIETELRRRYDLIPNLVETVKGYATHEKGTLEAVMAARNAAVVQGPIEQQIASQNALSASLGRLMAVSEAYPQLKANENFNSLQRELSETETRISQARRYYNAVVKEYNTSCQMFPNVLIANTCGFFQRPYFGNEDPDAMEPVRISFDSNKSAADPGVKLQVKESEELHDERS